MKGHVAGRGAGKRAMREAEEWGAQTAVAAMAAGMRVASPAVEGQGQPADGRGIQAINL